MRIKNNINSLNTNNKLQKNRGQLEKSLEKLSSGYKINRASDDAAGLAISEKMRGQIRGLNMASKNIQDGISLIQTAEGGLGNIQDPNLIRLRELAIQAANDTLTNFDRQLIQQEVEHIKQGINEIANNTEFNGIKLLNNSNGFTFTKSVGTNRTSISNTTLIGVHDTNRTNGDREIITGVNDQLTIKFNNETYSITIDPGKYSSTGYINSAVNSKLEALGAPLKMSSAYGSWDDTHIRNFLTSTIPGEHFLEVEGTAFNELFIEKSTYNYTEPYEVWGREADFSVGYTVKSGVNDTLNFKVDGIDKSITLTEGAYSRSGLVAELNKQFIASGSNITASMSEAVGLNVSSNLGNEHYILRLTHNTSNSDNAIQLISGNALKPLFLRSAKPGDVWAPETKSSLDTNIDISNGLIFQEDKNEWQFTVDDNIIKTITLNSGHYTSTNLINSLNDKFKKISAGITAVDNNGKLSFTREMNGSSYSISDFLIKNASDELTLQIGANSGQSFSIKLTNVTTTALKIGNIDLSTREGANSAISLIDNAMEKVSLERSKFGAYQNRLEHAYQANTNTSENLQSAESHIRDTDMAKEMMNFTKNNILIQATQVILVQSNKQPEGILQLLQ
ncbi:flagellin [Lysinibacillus sp. FJAT-14745]|uniref:flagellin N-terminal helical domain-containing protein n=1 Tax=Lysinibacillus sp. FJAT-14745 TaxID=1704289 RepID=UPI0006ABC3CB